MIAYPPRLEWKLRDVLWTYLLCYLVSLVCVYIKSRNSRRAHIPIMRSTKNNNEKNDDDDDAAAAVDTFWLVVVVCVWCPVKFLHTLFLSCIPFDHFGGGGGICKRTVQSGLVSSFFCFVGMLKKKFLSEAYERIQISKLCWTWIMNVFIFIFCI